MSSLLKKQLKGYIISGVLATGTDFVIYSILSKWFLGYDTAKTISFFSGTIVAYLYNKYITFGHHEKSFSEITKFLILYSLSMVCNVTINHIGILILDKLVVVKIAVFCAFILATLVSMAINFMGQKFWVFKK